MSGIRTFLQMQSGAFPPYAHCGHRKRRGMKFECPATGTHRTPSATLCVRSKCARRRGIVDNTKLVPEAGRPKLFPAVFASSATVTRLFGQHYSFLQFYFFFKILLRAHH